MADLSVRTARPGGVTLVAVRIDNRVEAPGVDAHRVRLRSRIDGPTWPPRVEGVPARPWDGDRAEVVVPTGRVGSLGFASPAPPADPAVELLDVEPAGTDGEGRVRDATDDPSPEDVLRVLGDPSPPRDAVAPWEHRDGSRDRGGDGDGGWAADGDEGWTGDGNGCGTGTGRPASQPGDGP